MFNKVIKKLLISLITNPILIAVYFIFCYELDLLCKFGRMKHNIAIILVCMAIFLVFILFSVVKILKNIKYEDIKNTKSHYKIIWKYAACIIIATITCFYGVRIFQSGRNYNGKLAWVLDDLKNKRSVKLEHNNIYKDGVQGIFDDIDKKFTLPAKLYMSNGFKLDFNSDGTITSFETFVYGKDDKGKEKTYLIYYDSQKSKNITVEFRNVNADYNDDKLLEPLITTVNAISVENTVERWNEDKYSLIYYGKRNWGFNTDGIVNIDENGNEKPLVNSDSPIIGYTVSIFVPGKEEEYTKVRYNLKCDLDWSKSETLPKDSNDEENTSSSSKSNDEFYISKEVGYKLEITGAAAGRRSYSLNGTTDSGKTWAIINKDPFKGDMGVASGITFINDKIGFLGLSLSGGASGQLYRTDDGGISFKKVNIEEHKVKLDSGEYVNPFDLPSMPYEKGETYNMLIGQGSDGDYNGGSNALYESKDNGKTWKFIKEVEKSLT
ncbi:hypothetical protein [Clostridium sp. BJN0001]|uniref:WD40/YVTN/BNR-like repeat-containing protein n=1 Tax=Clostridium sp. BJN0001 TaxID=2930219 RepID=UPI001FD0AC9E|nr:hypothetical protein [Clostridium sp. BJN0001]